MIITQENYQELLNKDLQFKDSIVFPYKHNDEYVEYRVSGSYLSPVNDVAERWILTKLLCDGHIDNIIEFLENSYGYYPTKNTDADTTCWPDFRMQDYKAITRCVYNIFEIISGNEKVTKIPLTSLSIKIE